MEEEEDNNKIKKNGGGRRTEVEGRGFKSRGHPVDLSLSIYLSLSHTQHTQEQTQQCPL